MAYFLHWVKKPIAIRLNQSFDLIIPGTHYMNIPKRSLFIVGLTIMVLWLAACAPKNPVDDAASPPPETQTNVATPDIPTPEPGALRGIILDSFNAQDNFSWRYNSTTTLANGETHTTLVEYQAPHRYHIVSDGKGGLIIYDEKVYMLQDDQWSVADIPIDNIIDPDATERLENTITNITYLGAEYLDGKAMLVCRYQAQQKSGTSESPIDVTIWIGNDDQLPYKMNIIGQTLAIDGQTGEVKGIDSTSTVLYAYDPTISIESPQTP
jgi:hypothetical protein